MKLNIGCGEFYAQGWTNVDVESNDKVHPDVVASATALPFRNGVCEAVYMGHVLEHLTPDDAVRALVEAHRVLQAGGTLMIVGPDVFKARDMVTNGSMTEDWYDKVLNGAGRWFHDVHLWPCTARKMAEYASRAGFTAQIINEYDVDTRTWPVTALVGWQGAVICLKETP